MDEVLQGPVFGEQVGEPLPTRQRALAIEEVESVQGCGRGPGGRAVDLLGRQPDHFGRGADSAGEGLQDGERLGRAERPPLDEHVLEAGEGRRRVPRLPGLVDERAQPAQSLLTGERPDGRRLEVAVQRVSQVTRPVGEVAPELAQGGHDLPCAAAGQPFLELVVGEVQDLVAQRPVCRAVVTGGMVDPAHGERAQPVAQGRQLRLDEMAPGQPEQQVDLLVRTQDDGRRQLAVRIAPHAGVGGHVREDLRGDRPARADLGYLRGEQSGAHRGAVDVDASYRSCPVDPPQRGGGRVGGQDPASDRGPVLLLQLRVGVRQPPRTAPRDRRAGGPGRSGPTR